MNPFGVAVMQCDSGLPIPAPSTASTSNDLGSALLRGTRAQRAPGQPLFLSKVYLLTLQRRRRIHGRFRPRCEQEIGRKRLEAVPWAPLCIGCQEVKDGG